MENLIFKKDGIYVIIPEVDRQKEVEVLNDPAFVYGPYEKNRAILYGGRVKIEMNSRETLYFIVDGIYINYYYSNQLNLCDEISIQMAVNFLNQIENLGVDTFFQNYKASMQAMKDQLTELSNQLVVELSAHEDNEKSKMLDSIRNVLLSLICLLCTLSLFQNTGLENHQYIEAAESVISQYQ